MNNPVIYQKEPMAVEVKAGETKLIDETFTV